MKYRFLAGLGIGVLAVVSSAHADALKHEPQVPPELAFVRTVDVEGTLSAANPDDQGAQMLRVRGRYLDPDVNAFVGMMMGATHFNRTLYLGNPRSPDTSGILWNWGGAFGIERGIHLWELDVMGAVVSARVGPALAIVGEHRFATRWIFYHRSELNIFSNDVIANAEQGFYWMAWKNAGVSLGYRLMASEHMNRSGPYVGFRLYFNSPRIPIIFPSVG